MNKTVLAVFIATFVGAAPSFAQKSDQQHAHNETVTSIDKSIKDKHDEHTDDGHEEHELQEGQKLDEHGGEGADEHDDHESEHAHDKGENEDKDDEEHDETASASLDSNQMALANIKVSTLSPKIVNYTLYAPGEIFSNGYSSYRVSPRVASVVTRRHVALGDRVNKGQVLVTLEDSTDRRRYLNSRVTLETLLSLGVTPIVNENDTVATDEIRYGDNDRLAAQVSVTVGADRLVLLSDVDGFYSGNPNIDPSARRYDRIDEITPEIEAMAGDGVSGLSKGGMITKIMAARIATEAGCAMAITLGKGLHPLSLLENGARATWFAAQTDPQAKDPWSMSTPGQPRPVSASGFISVPL